MFVGVHRDAAEGLRLLVLLLALLPLAHAGARGALAVDAHPLVVNTPGSHASDDDLGRGAKVILGAGNDCIHGLLDDVVFFGGMLTPKQVADLFASAQGRAHERWPRGDGGICCRAAVYPPPAVWLLQLRRRLSS